MLGRTALLAALLATASLALAPGAGATTYAGSTSQYAKLALKITTGGTVTSLTTETGRLQTCGGEAAHDSRADPVEIRWRGPSVAVVGGRFHLAGTTTDDYKDAWTFAVDGTVSRDGRAVTGQITAGGPTTFGGDCTGTWPIDAVLAPRAPHRQISHMFQSREGSFSDVSFDYRNGAVTHLTARVGVECNGSSLDANVDSTAYGLDPIRVTRQGRFHVSGGVLDGYGVVNHYVISGRISGGKASGRISSWRLWDAGGGIDDRDVVTCKRAATWHSSQATAPATLSGPTAYFDVLPWRVGRAGAWRYYLQVSVSGCLGAATVTVAVVGGPHLSASCHGSVKLGPLAPKRRYRVSVAANRATGAKHVAPSPPSTVYLPGDDGVWVRT
jgi:hypothetical protein